MAENRTLHLTLRSLEGNKMGNQTLRKAAVKAWNTLKALLEIHPTIREELAAEHLQIIGQMTLQSGGRSSWVVNILAGLEIAQYSSMNTASKSLGITSAEVQHRLEVVMSGGDVLFRQWISQRPELCGKVVRRFGLRDWPYFQYSFDFCTVGSPRGEEMEVLLPLVAHPDVAALLADRFAELRGEMAKLSQAAWAHQRRQKLISALMMLGDLESIERLEAVIWSTKKTLREDHAPKDSRCMHIAELYLTARTYNCLEKVGKVTVSDLTETTANGYMNILGFGRRNFIEVVERLQTFGLTIKDWPGSIKAALASVYGEN